MPPLFSMSSLSSTSILALRSFVLSFDDWLFKVSESHDPYAAPFTRVPVTPGSAVSGCSCASKGEFSSSSFVFLPEKTRGPKAAQISSDRVMTLSV